MSWESAWEGHLDVLTSLDTTKQEMFLLACAKHSIDKLASGWDDSEAESSTRIVHAYITRLRDPREGESNSPLLPEMEDWWTRDEEESALPGLSEVLMSLMSISYARSKGNYGFIPSGVFHAYNAIPELFLKETLPDGFATLGSKMDAMEMEIPECVAELEFQTWLLARVAAGEDVDWDALLG